jgi:uncharacterized membrane protein
VSDRALRTAVVALALAGAAVAAYVLAARLGGTDLYCATGGCETVQNSRYSEILGIPVGALGVVAYLVVAASVLAGDAGRVVGAAVALAGAVFGVYLLVLQLAVIEAVCSWCLVNDAIALLLVAAAVLRLRHAPRSVRHA